MSLLIIMVAIGTLVCLTLLLLFLPDYWVLRKLAKGYVRPEYVRQRISARKLPKKVLSLHRLSRRFKVNLPEMLSLDQNWAQRLSVRPSVGFAKLVLEYCTFEAVFPLFLLALKNKRFAHSWRRWWSIGGTDDFLVRLGQCFGYREISPKQAWSLLGARPQELKRQAVNPEHHVRYLAVKALLGGGEDFREILQPCFHDPSPEVRYSLCIDAQIFPKEDFYRRLLDLVLNDGVFSVRCAAYERIGTIAPELFNPASLTLGESQVIHILDFLRPGEVADENMGFHYLESDNLMIRQKAAFFLERSGSLSKIFNFADAGDKISFARMVNLLEKAGEVHVTGFLSILDRTNNPSTLVAAAKLLRSFGSISLIARVAERIFRLMDDTDEAWMAYADIIEAISRRGDDGAMNLLKGELIRRKGNPRHLKLILEWLPVRGAEYYAPVLFEWLCAKDCPALEEIETALVRFPDESVIPGALELLTDFTSPVQSSSRICSLKVLVHKKTVAALRLVLEHFYLVPTETAKTMTQMMSQFLSTEFDAHVAEILGSWDNANRRSLIAALPGAGGATHYEMVLQALCDTDPEIRIAAIWSVLEFSAHPADSTQNSIGKPADLIALISDPDAQVRCNAVRALAASANPKGLQAVSSILEDKHEIDTVVKSVIRGLGESHGLASLEILLEKSAVNDEYVLDCIEALSNRKSPEDLHKLVDFWLVSTATAKYVMEKVFEKNGEICAPLLDSLLDSKTADFTENLQAIFSSTGFLDRLGYLLKSKNPEERTLAVKKLGKIGSLKAARYLVGSLRDPDANIRARTIEILGSLNSDFSSHLSELTHDPDRKVRQYAIWALERMSPVLMK